MVDPQHTQLVTQLEQAANAAQLERDTAKDRLEIAQYRLQQPNCYRWARHGAAWVFASMVGISGTIYALEKDALYIIPLATGVSLSAGLVSNAVDQRRQTAEKQDRVEVCRSSLAYTETNLRKTVSQYREAEETQWLLYGLNTSQAQLLALQEWMADPRRTIKDMLLETIDRVSLHFLHQSLDTLPSPLTTERDYRQLREQLLNPTFALQKESFLAHVFAKHRFLQEQELREAGLSSEALTQGTAIAAGSAVGALTGAGIAALSSSKAAIVNALTGTASVAAVVGAGLVAAQAVQGWLGKAESQRRQQESQRYQDAFTLTMQIYEAVMLAAQTEVTASQVQHLKMAQEALQALKKLKLKRQDLQVKQYAVLLGDRLHQCLHTPNPVKP
ncbi:MAG TPA: hypothetical protein V6D19_18040 [Stenomitos sp.]